MNTIKINKMEELNNMNKLVNDFNEYLEDKILKNTPSQSGESDCCGSPVINDIERCSECKEHCERLNADGTQYDGT
jgi:hypothetical protein